MSQIDCPRKTELNTVSESKLIDVLLPGMIVVPAVTPPGSDRWVLADSLVGSSDCHRFEFPGIGHSESRS